MQPRNGNELLFILIIVSVVTAIVVVIGLVAGCGSGDHPTTPAVQQARPQSVSGLPATDGPELDSDAVRPKSSSYLGDIDGDGDPTPGDAIKILRFVVGLDQPTSTERWLADVDGSRDVDVGDAIMVLRAAVGLEQWPLPWPGGGGPPPPPF